MGEMADYFLEEVMEMEDFRLQYRFGDISRDTAYDMGIIDEFGAEIGPYSNASRFKTCRCCGRGNLEWGSHHNKWRLFENGQLHNCPKNPLK